MTRVVLKYSLSSLLLLLFYLSSHSDSLSSYFLQE
jgi:hypothetical protein